MGKLILIFASWVFLGGYLRKRGESIGHWNGEMKRTNEHFCITLAAFEGVLGIRSPILYCNSFLIGAIQSSLRNICLSYLPTQNFSKTTPSTSSTSPAVPFPVMRDRQSAADRRCSAARTMSHSLSDDMEASDVKSRR